MAIATLSPKQPAGAESTVDRSQYREIYRSALRLILEGTRARAGWLAWTGDDHPFVLVSRVSAADLSPPQFDLPEPPPEPVLIDGRIAIAPIKTELGTIGSMGLIGDESSPLGNRDLELLTEGVQVVVSLQGGPELVGLHHQFVEGTRALDRIAHHDLRINGPRKYQRLAEALSMALGTTYCRLGLRVEGDQFAIQATAGRRLNGLAGRRRRQPLEQLPEFLRAFREKRAVVLRFDNSAGSAESRLFSSTTRTGVLVPFLAKPGIEGLVLVGEERGTARQPLTPGRLTFLTQTIRHLGLVIEVGETLERERRRARRADARVIEQSTRRRLAHQLHDEVGQALSVLLIRARWSLGQGTADGEELKILEAMAQQALDATRVLAQDVRRRRLDTDPLQRAKEYAQRVLRGGGGQLAWSDHRVAPGGRRHTLSEVGYVIKESMSNIARHAQASHVEVRLENVGNGIRVVIRDDGIGFQADQHDRERRGRGLGLVGNAERMASIGGRFEIQSRPGAGTIVVLEAPN